MKIDPKILTGGDLGTATTEPYGKGPLSELTLEAKFPRVSERRAALLDDDGETRDEDAIRAFYLGQIVGWNVTALDGSPVEFSQNGLAGLLELDAGLEGWIVREVQDLARFL